jgi:hypothetical protein
LADIFDMAIKMKKSDLVITISIVTVILAGLLSGFTSCQNALSDDIGTGTGTTETVSTRDEKPLITYTAEQYYPSEDDKTSVQIRLTFSQASAEIENLMMYDVTITAGTASVTTVNGITGVKTNKTIWLTSVTAPGGEGYITLSIKLKGVDPEEKTVVVYKAVESGVGDNPGGDDTGDDGGVGGGPTVTGVTVNPGTASVEKGGTRTFSASA